MKPTTGPVLCRRPLLTASSLLNMATGAAGKSEGLVILEQQF